MALLSGVEWGKEIVGRDWELGKWQSLLAAVVVLGCSSLGAQTVGRVAPGEQIRNLDTFKAELKAYHDCTAASACYQRDLDLQANRAIAFLDRRAARKRAGEKLALVLDIDETALSNYEEMSSGDFSWNKARFNAWVESAKAPAIAGTLRLCKEAERLGVSIFFLTGRAEGQRAVTEENLRLRGFDGWRQLILRQQGETGPSALAYKSAARGRIVADGYKIVLNVGDQWSDLRGKPMAEFSVKYPDPYYFIQ